MKIPYIKQSLKNSCGAAVAAMIMQYHGFLVTEEELIGPLKIIETGRTEQIDLRKIFLEKGFKIGEFAEDFFLDNKQELTEKGTIKIIQNCMIHIETYLDLGIPVIVNYSPTEYGHFSIIHAKEGNNFILHDSNRGENYKLSKKEFEKIWISGNKLWKKWFMVVEKL